METTNTEYSYVYGDPYIGEDVRTFATLQEMETSIALERKEAIVNHIVKSNPRNEAVLDICFRNLSTSDIESLAIWCRKAWHGKEGGDHYFRDDIAELCIYCDDELDRRYSEQEEGE